MSRRQPKQPRPCFQKIIDLIESHAPKHTAGWWNLNQDDCLLPKRVARQIYKLARDGRFSALVLQRRLKKANSSSTTPRQP